MNAPPKTADAVICGAGIAGVAAAWSLVSEGGLGNVALVEAGEPLSLTSDKSTECYRNWWPGPGDAATGLSNRSIDLMEALVRDSANRVGLNRRGYVFATANRDRAQAMVSEARVSCMLGAGELRVHDGNGGSNTYVANRAGEIDGDTSGTFDASLDGADVLLDPGLIAKHFPYLNPNTAGVVHVRRAGFLSAQQLGMLMLERARERGARLVRGQVTAVHTHAGSVQAVSIETPQGEVRIDTPVFVNCAGPYAQPVVKLLGIDLPMITERHCKLTFDDARAAFPREAPLLIWCDEVSLPFDDEQRRILSEHDDTRRLLDSFPAGVHGRPLGRGRAVMLYWTYDVESEPVEFPVKTNEWMPEILLRGMSSMIPALEQYFDALPKPYVDGGYYTKTIDNRPLIGPLPVSGAFISSAFSGYGIMMACAAGELLQTHVTGGSLPDYAQAFVPSRLDDPAYLASVSADRSSGQI